MKEKSIKQAVNSFDAEVSLKDDGIGITIDALFKGLEGIASSKTVIGEPICLDDV